MTSKYFECFYCHDQKIQECIVTPKGVMCFECLAKRTRGVKNEK